MGKNTRVSRLMREMLSRGKSMKTWAYSGYHKSYWELFFPPQLGDYLLGAPIVVQVGVQGLTLRQTTECNIIEPDGVCVFCVNEALGRHKGTVFHKLGGSLEFLHGPLSHSSSNFFFLFFFSFSFFMFARKASKSKVLHYRITGKGAVPLEMPFWYFFRMLSANLFQARTLVVTGG